MKNRIIQPILKWVGGKRQLLDEIIPLIPKKYNAYCEPFIGGGAVLLEVQPKKAIINDLNPDLINLYRVIKNNHESLIEELKDYKNESEFFYKIRSLDRNKDEFDNLTDVKRAARTLYLNKTCYNGLYRVNSAGEFNSPFGNYKNPNYNNEILINHLSKYFNNNDIEILNEDYSTVLDKLEKGDFVYLDPPYDPVSVSSNFTGYVKGGFDQAEQIRLRDKCIELDKKGIMFLLSNSSTDFIKEIYHDFNITEVSARRSINSKGNKRGEVQEVLVRNYAKGK